MEPATVAEIWRHPVKSMMGERVVVAERSVPGERDQQRRREEEHLKGRGEDHAVVEYE